MVSPTATSSRKAAARGRGLAAAGNRAPAPATPGGQLPFAARSMMILIVSIVISPAAAASGSCLNPQKNGIFNHRRRGGDSYVEEGFGNGRPAELVPSIGNVEATTRRLPYLVVRRGGYQEGQAKEEISLDEKVRRAMLKLGLTPPSEDDDDDDDEAAAGDAGSGSGSFDDECSGGVCEVPRQAVDSATTAAAADAAAGPGGAGAGEGGKDPSEAVEAALKRREAEAGGIAATGTGEDDAAATARDDEDADLIARRLAAEFSVDESLAMAAVGATRRAGEERPYDEQAARSLLEQEVERIRQVSEDSESVRTLVGEGFDPFLTRRALAFADMDIDDARAILLADQMDQEEAEEEERQQQQQQQQQTVESQSFKTVSVSADFDPTAIKPEQEQQAAAPLTGGGAGGGAPSPAKKEDVVFEATAGQIQELVLESPVPVLLDIYADWCGPCKILGPALEDIAVKSGGIFRLVKVNTDNERPVSSALEVTALPTVFGIRDGKIVNFFQGMPQSEKALQSFMKGLFLGDSHFDPPLTEEQKQKYHELTMKLVKMAGAACFSFSARERLQDRVRDRLEELSEQAGDFVDAEESTRIVRSLMSNVIQDPYEPKYRTINLKNKVIAAKVGKYPASLAILKSVGFRPPPGDDSGDSLELKKKVVNVAPLLVTRDCIDKWIDQTRHEVAKAQRKRKDEEARAILQKELAERGDVEEEEEEEKVVHDPNMCNLKLRMEGKKKVHEVSLGADDSLRDVLKHLPVSVEEGQEVQITCAAKRLVVKSSDQKTMSMTLRELRLFPAAAIVVAIGSRSKEEATGSGAENSGSSSLSQRAAKKKKKKKGSHTMQSIGIYSKDDNAKAELIDGGGGTWYEHDVTDDEGEGEAEQGEEEAEQPDGAEERKGTEESDELERGGEEKEE